MNASSSTPGSGLQFTHPYLAVVLGGGFTGMLAAAALSEYAEVIVVERERLPRTPALPTDLPHARHAHLLAAHGARMVEALVPGSVERWLAEGARRVPVPAELAGRASLGRPDRHGPPHLIACSRDLLDRVIRQQVPARPGVAVVDGTEAEELTGTAEHVTGVRVRDTTTGETYRLDADLVVDATGRHSTSRARLAALGLPRVGEDRADSAIVSATRIFRAPEGAENLPVLTSRSGLTVPPPGPSGAARAAAGRTLPVRAVPERTATLVPIEGGRWLVTLTGTGEDRPTQHAGRFVPFARRAGDPRIGDLIADAEPLSEVRLSRDTVNRRWRYEQLPSWPSGFLRARRCGGRAQPRFRPGPVARRPRRHRTARGTGPVRHGRSGARPEGPAHHRTPRRRALVRGHRCARPLPRRRRTTVCRAYVDAVTGPASGTVPARPGRPRDAAGHGPDPSGHRHRGLGGAPAARPPTAQPTASGARLRSRRRGRRTVRRLGRPHRPAPARFPADGTAPHRQGGAP
ncbi:FAD-dependent oxidoreductase [Streptomyces endophytica]|uniref:FAD-dependent monooxygenase n=1 Tax=Streptomyces endophytica TaxID=2991496 RepID=A0ABY6PEA3_9ACTN|nr:FAD-dependent monooxygenase [Streptomyces endophytica]UZJ31863.1 FAD-dependent monooxygenase [Streptomyces endophytica]